MLSCLQSKQEESLGLYIAFIVMFSLIPIADPGIEEFRFWDWLIWTICSAILVLVVYGLIGEIN